MNKTYCNRCGYQMGVTLYDLPTTEAEAAVLALEMARWIASLPKCSATQAYAVLSQVRGKADRIVAAVRQKGQEQ